MTVALPPSSGGANGAGPNGAAPADTPRPGGPPGWIAILAIGSLVLGALLIGLQLLGVNVISPAPSPTLAPTGQAAQRTWNQAASALGKANFQVQEPQTEYRPGETPTLLTAPRKLLQVILPSDRGGGYVVIYELPSNNEAQAAGEELLKLSTSGMAVVQYPRDTKFVLQRVGRTLVFFPWSAEANPDPRLPELAAALETLGTKVTLP